MKTNLCLSLSCLIAFTAVAAPRTWTFCADGKIKFQSGEMSFAKGGRIDAEFLRTDGTNVVLLVGAGRGTVPLASLSEDDRAYAAQAGRAPNEARLVREAEQQADRNRANAEADARRMALEKEADAIRTLEARAEKKAQAEAELGYRVEGLAFGGLPTARNNLTVVADANGSYSNEARDALTHMDEINRYAAEGNKLAADRARDDLKRNLQRLEDGGVPIFK